MSKFNLSISKLYEIIDYIVENNISEDEIYESAPNINFSSELKTFYGELKWKIREYLI